MSATPSSQTSHGVRLERGAPVDSPDALGADIRAARRAARRRQESVIRWMRRFANPPRESR